MSALPHERVPAGSPAGGQFSVSKLAETGTTLRALLPSRRSAEHTVLADMGVGEGRLSLLAPVEARTLAAQLSCERSDRAAVRARVDAYLHWRDLADPGPVSAFRAGRIAEESVRQLDAAKDGYVRAREWVWGYSTDVQGLLELEEAEEDLKVAVRRHDRAHADLRYLNDPSWRPGTVADGALDEFECALTHERFADPSYRGQVH